MQGKKNMDNLLKSGKIWPYVIGASIIFIFGSCIATIVVANKLPVEKSDTYMMGYHEADAKANDLIKARIAFDEKYKVEYLNNGLSVENSELKYRVTNLSGENIDDAKIKVVITRPNNHKNDQELLNPDIKDGVYTFSGIKLPIEGRWNIMAKINVGELQRFYNVKADTRQKQVYEY